MNKIGKPLRYVLVSFIVFAWLFSGYPPLSLEWGGFSFSVTGQKEASAATWYGANWNYRRVVTIDNTKVSGSSNLSDFPILFSTTTDYLKNTANGGKVSQADGGDIVFTDESANKLAHEIERYSSTTGELIAWVKVPTLKYNEDTTLYLYYGNSTDSENQWDAANTWNNDYKGVWHLKEDPSVATDGDCGGGSKEVCDSTSNNNDGDSNGGMTTSDQVEGRVNGSLDFETDDYLHMGTSSNLDGGGNVSFSTGAWIKTSSAASMMITSKRTCCSGAGFMFGIDLGIGDGLLIAEAQGGGASELQLRASNTRIDDGLWHHVIFVYNSSTPSASKIYIDGQDKTTSQVGSPTGSPTVGHPFKVASMTNISEDFFFDGIIDEVRFTNAVLSSDWIATEYNNQAVPGTFLSLGTEEGPPTIEFSASSASVNENAGTLSIELSLSAIANYNVSVDYSVTGGTATGSGTDYTLADGTATVTAGNTTTTIDISINNDALDETDETIVITLADPSNATLGANTTFTVTITDNDSTPTVQFTQSSSSVTEDAGSLSFQIELSGQSGQNVQVNYAVSGGTASGSGTDYTFTDGTATITAGNTTTTVSLTVTDDTLDETNETVVITLSSPTNATLGTNTTHTLTITDNDGTPSIAFTSTSSSGEESDTSVSLELSLSNVSGQNVSVSYTASGGTATGSGTDYTLADGTATVTAGNTTTTIALTVVDDTTDEDNETVIVTISSPTNATLGANTTHTYTITDNDEAPAEEESEEEDNSTSSTTEGTALPPGFPSIQPFPTSQASQTNQTQNIQIQPGDLIRGPDGIKVWIVNSSGYKRHIYNPQIFAMYGHLKWGNIKEVSGEMLGTYITSDLYRETTDYKVYKVQADGRLQRHHLNFSPNVFENKGYSWQQIFIINRQEYQYYQEGEEIKI